MISLVLQVTHADPCIPSDCHYRQGSISSKLRFTSWMHESQSHVDLQACIGNIGPVQPEESKQQFPELQMIAMTNLVSM